eukprot:11188423-Lingulodinium_polyedra.AAC.1
MIDPEDNILPEPALVASVDAKRMAQARRRARTEIRRRKRRPETARMPKTAHGRTLFRAWPAAGRKHNAPTRTCRQAW